jgi:VWFA-related protein
MKSLCARVLVVAVCVAGATGLAQQRFTTTTSLLTLDVSVLDSDGNPISDLGPDDFVVTLNNETQAVRTMVFLATQRQTTTETVRVPSLGAPTSPAPVSASASSTGPDPKLLVILIDDMSIHPTDSKGLFVAAERFIDTIPVRDWVGLTSTSGRMTVNPSLDRAPLMKELRSAFGWMNDPRRDTSDFSVGFMDALDADASGGALLDLIKRTCAINNSRTLGQLLAENECARSVDRKARTTATFARVGTRNQLDTYIAKMEAMASAPGVKQLVILTGGVALRPSESRDFIPVAQAAVAAGVQITMLMEDPDPDPSLQGPAAAAWVRDQRRMLQQAQTLAEFSGGQFFRVVGQADRFYQRVLVSASAIYRLGVDLPKDAPKDGNYKVAVTVKRRGARVFASRHAAPPATKPAVTPPITPGEAPAATPTEVRPAPVAPPAPVPPAPPTAVDRRDVAAVLERASTYLESYEKAFSGVVSEEVYAQEIRIPPSMENRPTNMGQLPPRFLDVSQAATRTLRADVLQTRVGEGEWVAFRDVYEVSGEPVRDRDARLQKLFVDAPPGAVDQARRILAESARYNLGALQRDINVPTMALTYLRASNQSRSDFSVDGDQNIGGVSAVVLEFKERTSPTIVRSADGDLPATGRVWVEPETGRVLKTEISLASRRSGAKITVTYGAVPELTMWVPVVMTEEYTGAEIIFGKATYSKFRQFAVSTAWR